LLKSNCILNNIQQQQQQNQQRTSINSNSDSYIDLTTNNNNNNNNQTNKSNSLINTIDLNSTLEIKIDLKSNSILSSSINNNNNKFSIDSGVGTVINSNKSGYPTLIHVNPIRSNREMTYKFDTHRNNYYSYYDYNDHNDYEDGDEYNDNSLNEVTKSNKININNKTATSNNNAEYCVDSVEPKCNELKRLIEEFKLKYTTKIKLINDNKLLTEKLNIVILYILISRCVKLLLEFFFYKLIQVKC
jgi:hypothetical protein